MTLRDALTHPWLTVRTQIALGLFFVVAALPKIADPPGFAHMVYNYKMLPGPLVSAMALVLPWAELLMGVALIAGIWRKTAAALVGVLLVVFIAAISFNLLRGNAIDCGCFDVAAANLTREERFRDMWMVILRDAGMLVLVAQGLLGARRVEEEGEASAI
ncbi:MAG TPA: MauE/DoxX family redox-associated membrane protein [Thermoanaerobaculia bacterium]|nr:MauE/DoxX family redox-associated membrane protein [Thermoanaerobaculia bacterium]